MAECPPLTRPPVIPGRRQRHALFNKAQVEELTKAKKICAAALGHKYHALLQARGITEGFLEELAGQISLCEQKSAEAVQQTIRKENYTVEEHQARKALLKAMAEIQCAAKQKYARSNPAMLRDYCVGKDVDASRAALEQYSQNILEKLGGNPSAGRSPSGGLPTDPHPVPADSLPGILPEKVAALTVLRARWIDLQSSQARAQALATSLRAERDALVQTITDQRIQIQFAAEAEWPASEPASASKRRAFLLQPSRPFSLAA